MASSNKTKTLNLVFTIVGIILLVIIVPLLAISVTLIIKGTIDKDNPPSIFGYAPLTVASGSMSGDNEDSFNEGDLIFIKLLSDEQKQQLEIGDVICYKTDDIFVTHRITSISYTDDGEIFSLITRGDANDTYDSAITLSNIYGIYTGKIAKLGDFADFLQTPGGIAVFVGVPVAAFILFDVTRLIMLNKKKSDEKQLQSKDEEIARLKEMLNQQQPQVEVKEQPNEQPKDELKEEPKEGGEG